MHRAGIIQPLQNLEKLTTTQINKMENNNTTPENVIPLPTEANQQPAGDQAEQPKKTMSEMIASIDLTGATPDQIIIELIGEIQKLAFSGAIALGLLERLKTEGVAQDEAPSTPEEGQ